MIEAYVIIGMYGDKSGGKVFGVTENKGEAESMADLLQAAGTPYVIEVIDYRGRPVDLS